MRQFLYSLLRLPISGITALRDTFDAAERRLVIQSAIIGVAVWIVVFTLKAVVHFAEHELAALVARGGAGLVFISLVIGALLMAAITRYTASKVFYRDSQGTVHELADVEGDGLERAIALYYASEPTLEQTLLGYHGTDARWQLPSLSLVIRKFFATLVTLGSGGSGGLEASVTLIGESMATALLKPRPLIDDVRHRHPVLAQLWQWWTTNDPDSLQTVQLSGIAAAIATLFNAPFAAAFFASEVMYRRRPIVEKLFYSLIAALIAYFFSNLASGGHAEMFQVDFLPPPPRTFEYYGLIVLMGVIIALISYYFGRLRTFIEHAFQQYLPNLWLRMLAGFLLTGAIAVSLALLFAFDPFFILGTSESAIDAAFNKELTLTLALVLLGAKLLATLITIGAGGSAGLLVPSIYAGAMVATALAALFGYSFPVVLIIPAMAASLVSIVNVPLAAILFVVEVFGSEYILPALVVMVVALLLSQRTSIYRPQRDSYIPGQIVPGFAVQRFPVPAAWHNRTLFDLRLRNTYGVSAIGIVTQRNDPNGQGGPRTLMNPDRDLPLDKTDTLIVLGHETRLASFAETLAALDQQPPSTPPLA